MHNPYENAMRAEIRRRRAAELREEVKRELTLASLTLAAIAAIVIAARVAL